MRILLGLLLIAPSLWLAAQSTDLPFFGRYFDDGLYLASAQGIAEGQGYRLMSLPGAPPQVKYPPLLPALMAAAWKAQPQFPQVLNVASWLAWLPFPLLLGVVWAWLRALPLSEYGRAGVMVVLALNYHLLLSSRLVMTDLWGLVFLLAALVAYTRGALALAGLALAAGCMTRTACLPLLLVLPAFLLWERRSRDAAKILLAALPALIWWYGRKWMLGPAPGDNFVYAYSEYGDHLQPMRLFDNLPQFVSSAGWLFVSGGPDVWWTSFLPAVFFVGGLAGIVRGWNAMPAIRPYVAFGACYSAIVLSWRFVPEPRFLLPLLPLLAVGLASEAERLASLVRASWHKGQRGGAMVVAAVFSLLFGFGLFIGVHGCLVKLPEDFATDRQARGRLQPFLGWARGNLPADAKVVGSFDGSFYLETGRRGARIPDHLQMKAGETRPLEAVLGGWARYALANGFTHLVVTEADFGLEAAPDQLAAVDRQAQRVPELQMVFRSAQAVCYRLVSREPVIHSGLN